MLLAEEYSETSLKELNLSKIWGKQDSAELTSIGAKQLTRLKGLESLDLYNCEQLGYQGVSEVFMIASLTSLNIGNCC